MSKIDFKDQYKHPKWQQKRLEALSESDFQCVRCGDKENTLHVHHKRYIKGRDIWQYDVSELAVLCAQCHQEAHREKDALNSIMAEVSTYGSQEILSLIVGYCFNVNGPAQINHNRYLLEELEHGCQTSVAAGIFLSELLNRTVGIDWFFDATKKLKESSTKEEVTIVVPANKNQTRGWK